MESGQSQFATLKLRSLALVPSSGARCAPTNSTYGSSTARLQLDAPAFASDVQIADSRPFRYSKTNRIKFCLYCKLVYICIVVKADCAAALGRKNKQNT